MNRQFTLGVDIAWWVFALVAIVIVGVSLPLLALGLYLIYGSPRLPDQPLAARAAPVAAQ